MGADLTDTAKGNASARRAAASEQLDGNTSRRFAQFRDFAGDSAFATNVTLEKLVVYEQAGGIVDGRSYSILLADGDRAAGLQRFAASQGRYFLGRQGFEDLWTHGRSFVYGAVNRGGMGVEGFGSVCLVLPEIETGVPDALGVFPEDTVKRYVDARGVVDGGRALREVTAWRDRADLALVERAAAVPFEAPAGWARMLCSRDDYLEVVVAGRLPPRAIAEARMPDVLRARLEELRAKRLLGESLTDVERGETRAYEILHAWRRRHGTVIEGVISV